MEVSTTNGTLLTDDCGADLLNLNRYSWAHWVIFIVLELIFGSFCGWIGTLYHDRKMRKHMLKNEDIRDVDSSQLDGDGDDGSKSLAMRLKKKPIDFNKSQIRRNIGKSIIDSTLKDSQQDVLKHHDGMYRFNTIDSEHEPPSAVSLKKSGDLYKVSISGISGNIGSVSQAQSDLVGVSIKKPMFIAGALEDAAPLELEVIGDE